ncbi:MAG: hypothetical protein ACQESP_03320 [Candidatus Muiribacteriota bacterium]
MEKLNKYFIILLCALLFIFSGCGEDKEEEVLTDERIQKDETVKDTHDDKNDKSKEEITQKKEKKLIETSSLKELLHDNLLAVLKVNYNEFVQTDIFQLIKAQQNIKGQTRKLDEFSQKTGFKPEESLNNIFILIDEEAGEDNSKTALAFDGDFNPKKMLKAFDEMETEDGDSYETKIYEELNFQVAPDGNAFAFFDKNTLLMGNFTYLKTLYDNFIQKKSLEEIPHHIFYDVLKDDSSYILTGIMTIMEETRKQIINNYPVEKEMADISKIRLNMNLTPLVFLSLDLFYSEAENAQKFAESLGNLKLMGIMYASKFNLNELVSKIDFSAEGKKVNLNVALTKDEIAQLIKIFQSMNVEGQKNNGNDNK